MCKTIHSGWKLVKLCSDKFLNEKKDKFQRYRLKPSAHTWAESCCPSAWTNSFSVLLLLVLLMFIVLLIFVWNKSEINPEVFLSFYFFCSRFILFNTFEYPLPICIIAHLSKSIHIGYAMNMIYVIYRGIIYQYWRLFKSTVWVVVKWIQK